MRTPAPILITLWALLLSGCGSTSRSEAVSVEQPRITLPAVKGRPGAAYFTVQGSGTADRLATVASPRVERIELHESMAGGMGPLRDTSVPTSGALSFEPGGRHAMLFGIDPAVKVGDRVPLTFTFERAPAVTVQAEVLGPGGAGHISH